jgi:type II secretory pathway pseudopilin PulG
MRSTLRRRVRPSDDGGFSLVEAIVALGIAAAVFTALAFALIGGAHAALLSQQNQQAGDVLNKAVEEIRALPYDSVAMRQTDLNVGEAPRSPAIGTCNCYNPTNDTTSGTGLEDLFPRDPNGAVAPHVNVVTAAQNGGSFTVRRYVTSPVAARTDPADASSATYKRLTVVVTWSSRGKVRTRTYSTLIAPTKRGLPLPDFKFTNTAALSQCRNPGSSTVYAFSLKNNGARDAWNLTPTPSAPGWVFHADTDGDGSYGAGDTALPVTAGLASTGPIEPTAELRFFAVATLASASTQPPPYTLTTTFRATSAAQPTYFQELVATTTVQAGPCGAAAVPSASPVASPTPAAAPPPAPTQPAASCDTLTGTPANNAPGGTLVRYYLQNPDQPGDTTARVDMPVQRDTGTPPAIGPLYNYSTDLHTVAGRKLVRDTDPSAPDGPSEVANWTYEMPGDSTLKGDGSVTFWAAIANGVTTARPSFSVTLDVLSASGTYLRTVGSTSYVTPTTGWGCTGYQRVAVSLIDINGSGDKVAANEKLRLSIRETGGVDVLLAYGTAAYPTRMTLPYKSGLG